MDSGWISTVPYCCYLSPMPCRAYPNPNNQGSPASDCSSGPVECAAIGGVGPRLRSTVRGGGRALAFQVPKGSCVGGCYCTAVPGTGPAGAAGVVGSVSGVGVSVKWKLPVGGAKQIFFFAARPCRLRVGILIKLTPHPSIVPKIPSLLKPPPDAPPLPAPSSVPAPSVATTTSNPRTRRQHSWPTQSIPLV